MADISELQKPDYATSGIYYHATESNTKHGVACVFGPEGTPYEDCPMLYEFTIPETYPFDPPKVEFRTHDGKTRFHPNMYIEGKCCLSILHTWQGPKWASTMRLSTVLVTLQSLMDTNPIQHEPGYATLTAANPTAKGYSYAVEYACIQYILKRAEGKAPVPSAFLPFEEVFRERLPGILNRLEARLLKRLEEPPPHMSNLPYSMACIVDYAAALARTRKLIEANLNKQ